ncbi:hypothetical protein MTO96_039548 [Rhipicephalus appendiculatus]
MSRYDLLDTEGKYDVPGMYRRAVGGIDTKTTRHPVQAPNALEPPAGQRDGQSKSSNRPTWADKLKTPKGTSTPVTNTPPAPDPRDQELRALRVEFTTYNKFKKLQFIGVSAPTGYPLPLFRWSLSGFNDSHVGHPDLWNFEPVENVWGSCT